MIAEILSIVLVLVITLPIFFIFFILSPLWPPLKCWWVNSRSEEYRKKRFRDKCVVPGTTSGIYRPNSFYRCSHCDKVKQGKNLTTSGLSFEFFCNDCVGRYRWKRIQQSEEMLAKIHETKKNLIKESSYFDRKR